MCGLDPNRELGQGLVIFMRLTLMGMALRWTQLYVVVDRLNRGVHMPGQGCGGLTSAVKGPTGGCSGVALGSRHDS